jgi:twinkle protein
MSIENIAARIDEARKLRIIKTEDIDVEKYLKNHDVSAKVRSVSDFLESVEEKLLNKESEEKSLMPWPKTHQDVNFRQGEVTVYAGSNGGGKSLITGLIAMFLVRQRKKVCIASFEMNPETTIIRMLRQFAGENIFMPLTHDTDGYTKRVLRRFDDFASKNLYLYDQQGSVNPQTVIAMARYCAVELGVQHIFIDSLMKCVMSEDDLNEQKYFVNELCALARDHKVHIHLIHHIRKLVNEELLPNKNDLKGSGSIADQVDNVFLIHRNKKKENARRTGEKYDEMQPDCFLMCQKQRNGEAEEFYGLWYEGQSQQFLENIDGVPIDFDNRGGFRG